MTEHGFECKTLFQSTKPRTVPFLQSYLQIFIQKLRALPYIYHFKQL